MKRFLIILTLLTVFLLPVTLNQTSYAFNLFPSCGQKTPGTNTVPQGSSVCPDVNSQQTTDPIITIIKAAIDFISYIAGAAAVILIIVSGLRFVMASGDASKVASARGTLVYALIGIVITFLAQGIVAFVLDRIS